MSLGEAYIRWTATLVAAVEDLGAAGRPATNVEFVPVALLSVDWEVHLESLFRYSVRAANLASTVYSSQYAPVIRGEVLGSGDTSAHLTWGFSWSVTIPGETTNSERSSSSSQSGTLSWTDSATLGGQAGVSETVVANASLSRTVGSGVSNTVGTGIGRRERASQGRGETGGEIVVRWYRFERQHGRPCHQSLQSRWVTRPAVGSVLLPNGARRYVTYSLEDESLTHECPRPYRVPARRRRPARRECP